ncbi:hypothetical protein A3K69_03880 [Candidatus Bathyarchaeota archaeon RBG_16_57_9]|nr:MAG: hypothetical protein A3K69_03880 [Candidatus Bathyarchaeota archaeon RBG_16_57_9]
MHDDAREALSHLGAENHVYMATVDGDIPRVRTMTVMRWKDGIYFATDTGSDKVRQIEANPNVEFLLPLREGENTGYVRIQCTASGIADQHTVEELFRAYAFIGKLWDGPRDPKLRIVRLAPSSLDYLRPGEWSSVKHLTQELD